MLTVTSAPYIPNTVLVNSGDIMQHWTNGTLLSTKHRVIQTPQNEAKSRYSVGTFQFHITTYSLTVYFCVPDWESEVNMEGSKKLLVGDLIPFL
jgi:isopenicillin N synthase-like dioxygenase